MSNRSSFAPRSTNIVKNAQSHLFYLAARTKSVMTPGKVKSTEAQLEALLKGEMEAVFWDITGSKLALTTRDYKVMTRSR